MSSTYVIDRQASHRVILKALAVLRILSPQAYYESIFLVMMYFLKYSFLSILFLEL